MYEWKPKCMVLTKIVWFWMTLFYF
jgi:hypothetical protein